MNTNNIKYFAQQARLLLLEGVSQRLMYWGFDAKGNNNETLETTHGGYIFRGEIYNDSTVPAKWNALRNRLTDKQAVNDVIEEAAYTWFNRLMAIKILEENQYLDASLQYAEGVRTPMLVQNAKQGNHSIKGGANRDLLIDLLKNNQEEQAFALLVTNMCNENKLLHDVFGHINDYTELLLPHNLLQKDGLMDLINNGHIEKEDYQEVELIGWLYQFYISDKKDEVFAGFKKNKKARAEDIPAATQIFTPKWIVKYMVENTVGKIYLDYEMESDLRSKMKYLVEQGVEDKEQGLESSDSSPLTPHPSPLINDITELTLLDPACGSGHILVTGFELLFEMYLEVGYTARNAVNNILEHNLFGLDIDDRAMQLARFAVLLKGAELLKGNGSGVSVSREFMTNFPLIPHIYSFAEEQHFESEELQSFLGGEGQQYSAELKDALTLLNQGKNIGSALKIDLSDGAVAHIEKQYNVWQQKQQNSTLDLQQTDIWNRLQPMLDVLLVLAKKYSAVVANPPYMGQGNMNADLKKYVNTNYPLSKSDLFAVFIESMTNMLLPNARVGCITMESWMFLSSYEKLRLHILNNYSIVSLAHFGWHIIGIAFGTAAMILENSQNIVEGEYSYLTINDVDRIKNEPYVFPKKDNGRYRVIPQTNFSKIPGSPIAYWVSKGIIKIFEQQKLAKISNPRLGMATANNNLFTRFFWEVDRSRFTIQASDRKSATISKLKWFPYAKGGEYRKWYGNMNLLVNWQNDGEDIRGYVDSRGKVRSHNYNLDFIFKKGITWNALSSKNASFRLLQNSIFDNAGSSLFLNDSNQYYYILGLLNTKIIQLLLTIMNPTLNYQPGTIGSIPIITDPLNDYYVKDCLMISKKDWDSHETSWDFKQSPLINDSLSLSEAYQQWDKDVTKDFFQLHANEEELNRIFIDIYGLQDELTPDVALKDITILQDELDRKALEELEPVFREQGKEAITLPISKEEVVSQFISYAIGVFMGRYRLDKPGLNIAHPKPTEEETKEYLVIRGKGLGATAQELILNYIRNEYPEFSRFVGLAKSDGLNNRSVSCNSNISERGDVWTESTIEEGSSIHTEQHSRGASTRNQRVSSLSENSQGLSGRSGNTAGNSSSAKLPFTGQNEATDDANNRNIKNVEWVKQQAKSLMQELGIREQGTGIREQGIGVREKGTGSREEGVEEELTPHPSSLIPNNPSSLIPNNPSSLIPNNPSSLIPNNSSLLTPHPSFLTPIQIDEDGIVPLMGNHCAFPNDALKRITELVLAIWGEESLTENINFIHNALGMDLHRWLTEKFWDYHISGKMYKKKPIYWLFSSNVRRPQNAAFKVLVYMHRMDRYTVNKIQRNYLYPHQDYISREIKRLVANEANLSRDDLKQLEQLRKWEIECRDYSEVLKELANKEIAFDLDDGVTENYKLFEGAVANI